ncbi:MULTISPECIES: DUF3389 domain-containing protein [Photobacterium]|uniref:PTS sugar transporter subunit IIA n=1 Tax=Photobacterium halotolerans TaxID=265726 RepID=A0A0F5VB42_9GAMM|nr:MULTISPECIES: DUF3389 domain-containing protein [Photobacterium]KKC99390.1 PTS sugar transporter subunit IIA [Photobacterium halotolerans]UIP29812.1 DUF3389 domain-containing protein [Photobacterium sp. TLY01]
MILTFSQGRIVANQHELVIRLDGAGKVNLQARADDIRLLRQPNMITATGSGVQWSIHLDDDAQLEAMSDCMGIAIDSHHN